MEIINLIIGFCIGFVFCWPKISSLKKIIKLQDELVNEKEKTINGFEKYIEELKKL